MKRKLLIALIAVSIIPVAVSQPVNQSSDVNPGLTPGNPLYAVESFVENVEVKFAGMIGGPDMKAKALANNAEERLAEADAMIEKNRSNQAAKLVEKYSQNMNRSHELASGSNDTRLREKLSNISRKNTKRLEQVKEKVPEQARQGIQNAIDKSKRNTGKSPRKPENIPGQGNSEEAPGNMKKSGKTDAITDKTSRKPGSAGKMNETPASPQKKDGAANLSNGKEKINSPNKTGGPEDVGEKDTKNDTRPASDYLSNYSPDSDSDEEGNRSPTDNSAEENSDTNEDRGENEVTVNPDKGTPGPR